MKHAIDLAIEKGTIVLTDKVNKGTLVISFKTPADIGENDTNPLYEIANGLTEKLYENNELLLQLHGDNNKILVTRSYLAISGHVMLDNVDIKDPCLRDCGLSEIQLPNTSHFKVFHSIISNISATTSSSVSFKFCHFPTGKFLHVLDPKVDDSFEYKHNVAVEY